MFFHGCSHAVETHESWYVLCHQVLCHMYTLLLASWIHRASSVVLKGVEVHHWTSPTYFVSFPVFPFRTFFSLRL